MGPFLRRFSTDNFVQRAIKKCQSLTFAEYCQLMSTVNTMIGREVRLIDQFERRVPGYAAILALKLADIAEASENSNRHNLGIEEIQKSKLSELLKLRCIEKYERGSNRRPSLIGFAIKITPIKNMANASGKELAAMRERYNLEDQVSSGANEGSMP